MALDNTTQFLIELRDLLALYEASIDIDYDDCSDMAGVVGECTGVCLGRDDHFHDRMTVKVSDGWGIDARCLNRLIERRQAENHGSSGIHVRHARPKSHGGFFW